MKLNNLPKTTTRASKRKGRGFGSGKGGHTATRGQKGQKSRSSVKLFFEGGQLPLTKRLPYLRGKHRFNSLSATTVAINLDQLNTLKDKTKVTPEVLVKNGLVSLNEAANGNIKILGRGKLEKSLTVEGIKTSKSAADKIKKAGGSVKN